MTFDSATPPVTFEWLTMVGGIAKRDGHAVRAGANNTIEVQSINTGQFQPLMLATRTINFPTEEERDAALAIIHRAQ